MGIPCGGRKLRKSACRGQLSSFIYVCVCSPTDWGRWVGKMGCSNAEGIWVMRVLVQDVCILSLLLDYKRKQRSNIPIKLISNLGLRFLLGFQD